MGCRDPAKRFAHERPREGPGTARGTRSVDLGRSFKLSGCDLHVGPLHTLERAGELSLAKDDRDIAAAQLQ